MPGMPRIAPIGPRIDSAWKGARCAERASAVQVFRADEGLLGAVGAPRAAREGHEVLAVHVDLDRVTLGGIVHAVDLVVARDEPRDGARAVARHALDRDRGLARSVLRDRVARLLDLVVDDADDTSRLVVVGPRPVA